MQSMPDVSPTKWHRAHTSWFFETFLLLPSLDGLRGLPPRLRLPVQLVLRRGRRPVPEERPGPGVATGDRRGRRLPPPRRHPDGDAAAGRGLDPGSAFLVELGIQHEQQHQELLLMDIKHVLSRNPMLPAYLPAALAGPGPTAPTTWTGPPRGDGRDRPRRRRVRLRQRVPPAPRPPRALRPGRPHRDLRRVAGVHRRRRVPASRAVAVRRVGRRWRPRAGRHRSTGPTATAGGGSSPWPARCRSTRPGRSATSATTRPTPTPAGPGTACPPRPSGRR